MRILAAIPLLCLVVPLVSCTASKIAPVPPADGMTQAPAGNGDVPSVLPQDRQQPWEQEVRAVSGLNRDSELVLGFDRYVEGGDAADLGDATRLQSGSSGGGSSSWAMYRLVLAGAEPGVVSVDVNPRGMDGGGSSGYFIGLADYAKNHWEWHGPFTDNHVRLSTARAVTRGASYLSGLGNLFVAVVVYDGARADVIAVGANVIDGVDTEAPPAPAGLTSDAVSGGLELNWNPVIAGDLAGYLVYYSSQPFIDGAGTGVKSVDYLEGLASHLLVDSSPAVFVRVSAVDISGNESALSDIVSAEPLPGAPPDLALTASAPGGMLNDVINLTASGAESYDWDLDGDGVFDVTGDSTGSQVADTSATGILRPRVRGTTDGGQSVALGGASLLIAGNSRPLAIASASPQSGPAPLDVTLTGQAEDYDGEVVGAGWDFDGDGTYDVWSDSDTTNLNPPPQNYSTPGIYNARLRVIDDGGAYDTDTVAILVTTAGADQPPVAFLQPGTSVKYLGDSGNASFTFDASDSYDPEGGALNFAFDLSGDGVYQDNGSNPVLTGGDYSPGVYLVRVRVTDAGGADSEASALVRVYRFASNFAHQASEVGGFSSLAVVKGHPAIAYYSGVTSDLLYVRANDAAGTSWGAPVLVQFIGDTGLYCDLDVVDGLPAIVYWDLTATAVGYIRAYDEIGNTWPTLGEVVSLVNCQYPSLEVVNGKPAVAYYNSDSQRLEYSRSLDAEGGAWPGSATTLDTGGVGQHADLRIVNGFPAVAYYDETNTNLKYVRALNANGGSWDSPVTVDASDQNVGTYLSLAIPDGQPAISYFDFDSKVLLYVRAEDSDGAAWGSPQVLDDENDVGDYTSMSIIDGHPAIAYHGATGHELRFIQSLDSTGALWAAPIVIDRSNGTGTNNSLVELPSGLPAVSYMNSTGLEGLRFAVAQFD